MNTKATTPDEQQTSVAYVRAVDQNISKKLADIQRHKDAIAILRKEINRDIKAARTVADRHGFTIESTRNSA